MKLLQDTMKFKILVLGDAMRVLFTLRWKYPEQRMLSKFMFP